MAVTSVEAAFVSSSPEEEKAIETGTAIGTVTGTAIEIVIGVAIGIVTETEIAIVMIREELVILTQSALIVMDMVTGLEIVQRREIEANATTAENSVISLESARKGK
eukprot:TRINITY_DN1397_c0_g1_i1.p3 TRINITY_DN1397_c0_g1~~TRINITY_DN1397_c0_g1_i1.p3  ORF type:complete len:107 (-),score=20.34 TRINITY_DN1397_c0_g1_i1:504-824(-)